MKKLLIITAFALPLGIFAQGPNTNIQINPPPQIQMQSVNYINQIDINNDNNINIIQTNLGNQLANPPTQVQTQGSFFGSENNNEKPCNDCDEVKQAIKISKSYSSGKSYGKTFSMKKWTRKVSGKADMKLRKVMAQKKKIKTSFDCCFNWG